MLERDSDGLKVAGRANYLKDGKRTKHNCDGEDSGGGVGASGMPEVSSSSVGGSVWAGVDDGGFCGEVSEVG